VYDVRKREGSDGAFCRFVEDRGTSWLPLVLEGYEMFFPKESEEEWRIL